MAPNVQVEKEFWPQVLVNPYNVVLPAACPGRAAETLGIPLALNVLLCMPAMHVYMRVAVHTQGDYARLNIWKYIYSVR